MQDGVELLGKWNYSKASETYMRVRFQYTGHPPFEWSVPIVYPRLGLELLTDDEIIAHIATVYEQVHPDNHARWREAQESVWKGSRSDITKPIFDAFVKDFAWLTYADLPGGSSNAARRLQALKELGYTVATRKRPGFGYEFMVLPMPRGAETGYEWWSGTLRKRIVRRLAGMTRMRQRWLLRITCCQIISFLKPGGMRKLGGPRWSTLPIMRYELISS